MIIAEQLLPASHLLTPQSTDMDHIRVMRVLVYEGPRDILEAHLSNCVQGTKTFGPSLTASKKITIRALTVNDFPELISPPAPEY